MPETPKKTPPSKVRLNLEFLTTVNDLLEGLLKDTGAPTKVEVIRQGLRLLRVYVDHIKAHKGNKVILRHHDGTEERVLILM